jgi:hypothetical protein
VGTVADVPVPILCRPATIHIRTVRNCPTCKQRRRMAGFDQLWYGPTLTCLGCGDSWSCEGRLERPFRPRWRRDVIESAQRLWADAVAFGGIEHLAWLADQVADEQQVVSAAALVGAETAGSPHEGGEV